MRCHPERWRKRWFKPKTGLSIEQQKTIEALAKKIDDLEKSITANSEDDAHLVEIRLQLEEVNRELLASGQAFRPRLAEISARLDQLGAPPEKDAPPEPSIVTQERQDLAAEKADINAILGAAENLSIRTSGLVSKIADMRRELFARLLTKRYDLDLTLGSEVSDAVSTETDKFYRTVSSWLHFVVQFKLNSMLAATFFALVAAVVLLIGGRRLFGGLFEPDPTIEDPSYLSRLSVAFWSTLTPTAAVGVFFTVTYLLYDYFGVLRGDIGTIMSALFLVIGIIFFVYRLASRRTIAASSELAVDSGRGASGQASALAGYGHRRLHRPGRLPEHGLPRARLPAFADRGRKPVHDRADRHSGDPYRVGQAIRR